MNDYVSGDGLDPEPSCSAWASIAINVAYSGPRVSA